MNPDAGYLGLSVPSCLGTGGAGHWLPLCFSACKVKFTATVSCVSEGHQGQIQMLCEQCRRSHQRDVSLYGGGCSWASLPSRPKRTPSSAPRPRVPRHVLALVRHSPWAPRGRRARVFPQVLMAVSLSGVSGTRSSKTEGATRSFSYIKKMEARPRDSPKPEPPEARAP